ncbi:MAG: hypothetical protein K8S99_18115 [Planctomycetes bacterium]|nr:hypothetical protein [Planctomycetota bacterium]
MSEPRLFPDSTNELLVSVYLRQGRTLDDLPYTPEFDALCDAMGVTGKPQRAEIFHHLHNLRKASRLPRLGRAAEKPPRIDPSHEAMLAGLVEQALGKLSLRDQLPYTDAFDQLVVTFNSRAGLSLSPYAVWRIIAKLAK